jgi:hypothetical protein
MNRDRRRDAASIVARADPRSPGLLHLEVRDDSLGALGLTAGCVLEAERGRPPLDGDLVWVELVRKGQLVRLLRRFAACEGVVTLSDPLGREPAIIRQSGELLVRAVVTTPLPDPPDA